jgi:phosphate transport system substrate-binding protein
MHKTRRVWAIPMVAALAILGAACSSDKTTATTNSSPTGSSSSSVAGLTIDYTKLSGSITGGGSSFQDTYDQAVITQFKTKATGLTVTYTKSGSGKGISDLATAVIDFGGTDRPVKDTEKATFTGGDFLYFPTVAAPITVSYNQSGVDKTKPLQFDGPTLTKIFSGTITSWSDPAIAASNSGVTGLTGNIVVCHRDADSGTTANFVSFLDKVDHADMTLQVSGNPNNWPAGSIAGTGNGGVASCITGTPGAIGYVDVADAIKAQLTYASIKNTAGKFIQPTLDGTKAAVAGSLSTLKADLTYDPINAGGDASYPIASPTWIIVYKNQPTKARGEAVRGFLNFILTDGQAQAASAGYAPLSTDLQAKAIAQLSQLVVPAQ